MFVEYSDDDDDDDDDEAVKEKCEIPLNFVISGIA